MKKTDPTSPDSALVTQRALYLWQLAGSPSGRDQEFWLQAEAELNKERAQIAEQAHQDRPGSAVPKSATAKTGTRRAK